MVSTVGELRLPNVEVDTQLRLLTEARVVARESVLDTMRHAGLTRGVGEWSPSRHE
jgi:hypothetical protein